MGYIKFPFLSTANLNAGLIIASNKPSERQIMMCLAANPLYTILVKLLIL
jgi:hypothetical protein